MELNHLRTFIAVAEEKNLTKAAERLFMTPPSVSAHIKALEDELHVSLFVRKPQGMEITEHGEILRLKAEKIVNSAREMINLSKRLQTSLMGVTRIGLSSTPSFQRAAKLIMQMQEVHPEVELTFIASATSKILRALKNHSMDAGYVFGPLEDEAIEGYLLGKAELVVAVPISWEKQIANADWQDIADFPWIASADYCPAEVMAEKIFRKKKITTQNKVRTDDDATKVELVKMGIGAALLERNEAEQGVAEGKLLIWNPKEVFISNLSWVHLKNRKDDPLISALTEQVLRVWDVV